MNHYSLLRKMQAVLLSVACCVSVLPQSVLAQNEVPDIEYTVTETVSENNDAADNDEQVEEQEESQNTEE